MCSRVPRLLQFTSKILYRSSTSYTCRVLEPRKVILAKAYSTDKFPKKLPEEDKVEDAKDDEGNLASGFGEQYTKFRDEDASVIFDVDEERKKMVDLETVNTQHELRDPYEGLNLQRGISGVYDIEDLVDLLRKDKAKEIFVVSVPQELAYVDYLVIVTARSTRHMSALATFARKLYKMKANPSDLLPKIEGANSKDWVALDLGNIALHIFTSHTRRQYDLETLWTVGGKYDELANKPSAREEFDSRYNNYLAGLRPRDE